MRLEIEFEDGEYNWEDLDKLVRKIEKAKWKVQPYAILSGIRLIVSKDYVDETDSSFSSQEMKKK